MATTYDYTENNSIELLKDANKAAELKIELIRKAKHHIHIVSYYLDNSNYPTRVFDELKKAHERGVEVRILATYIPTLVKDITMKTKRNLKVAENGSTFAYMLLGVKGNVTILNNLHEKIFLIDGETAVIGGRNLSDAAFDAKDLEVKIQGGMVNQLQDHFLKLYNTLLAREKSKHCSKWDIECLEEFDKTTFNRDDRIYFPVPKNQGTIKGRVLTHNAVLKQIEKKMSVKERFEMSDDVVNALVESDFKTMRAYNYYVLPTSKYASFLYDSLKAGKDVKLVTNSLKTSAIVSNKGYLYSLPTMYELVSAGLPIYQWQGPTNYNYLHEKVVILDEEHVFVGSHNFGTGSTTMSNEVTVEFHSKEIGNELSAIFDEEIQNSNKTILATNLSLAREMADNKKMINFLHKTFFGTLIQESY